MKRVGYIYENIISVKNCREAIINASKRKRKRGSVEPILKDLDFYAHDLSERLANLDFTTPYRERIIKDGLSGKERKLEIPSFYPDQCAHHAIVQVLKPIVEKSSYYWSCANMPKRGIKRASIGVERATIRDQRHAKYCVKLDIRKFYQSIPHDRLKESLRTKIKDKKALQIINKVIDSYEDGIPIGNYTSPWFAELFLQPLDYYIKQELGVKHYVRYADDMVLIGNNKRKLHKTMHAVIQYVNNLGMEIKANYQLFQIMKSRKDGRIAGRKIDFIGKCYGRGFTTVRKRCSLAFMRQSRCIQQIQSDGKCVPYQLATGFLTRSACLLHANSFGLRKKYYETVNVKSLKEVIRYESKRKLYAGCTAHRSIYSGAGFRRSSVA